MTLFFKCYINNLARTRSDLYLTINNMLLLILADLHKNSEACCSFHHDISLSKNEPVLVINPS